MRLPNQTPGRRARVWNQRRAAGIRPSVGLMSVQDYRNRHTREVNDRLCPDQKLCAIPGLPALRGFQYFYVCCPPGQDCGDEVGGFPSCVGETKEAPLPQKEPQLVPE